ncbi:hypothetical protein [Sphingobacterium puteale]
MEISVQELQFPHLSWQREDHGKLQSSIAGLVQDDISNGLHQERDIQN